MPNAAVSNIGDLLKTSEFSFDKMFFNLNLILEWMLILKAFFIYVEKLFNT